MNLQETHNEYDMLKGNVNRMFLTDEVAELVKMYEFAQKRHSKAWQNVRKRRRQTELKEIIKVMDDGTQGRVEHGAVIEIQDDSIGIECLNIMPVDVVRVAIGILKVVHEMGMDEVLKQMYGYCFEEGGADGGTEELQTDNRG